MSFYGPFQEADLGVDWQHSHLRCLYACGLGEECRHPGGAGCHRFGKSEAGETVVYLYDGSNVVQELSGGDKNSIFTGLGIDQPFARSNGEDRTCFWTDCLSGTWALTDGAGAPR